MVKIAVLVSGGGTNLQALIDAQNSGHLGPCEIALVISNNVNAYALKRAEKHKIRYEVCQSEDSILNLVKAEEIDFIVLAGFLKILSKEFIASINMPIINIHPSLIPAFCGKGCYGIHVHEKALKYGVKVSGATVHFVNEIPDGGEIILQKAVDVKYDDTPETLQRRIMEEAEWILLPKACQIVAEKIANK
ncbi:phosphoribosylglycinamide formyltransferase [Eubacteriales bacterium KG127]